MGRQHRLRRCLRQAEDEPHQLLEIDHAHRRPRQLEGIVGTRRYGHVLEAKLDRGTRRRRYRVDSERNAEIGDQFIVGNTFGKVRAMSTTAATPSIPHRLLRRSK